MRSNDAPRERLASGDDGDVFAAAERLAAACRAFDAAWTRCEETGSAAPHRHPDIIAARRALEQAGAHFALTPARTLPGLTVKLRHLVQDVEEGRTFWTQALARAVLTDAENMCG